MRRCGGPYEVTIDEIVADVLGIAYTRDYAIGMLRANEKTFGGMPYEFDNFDYSNVALEANYGMAIDGGRVALNRYWGRSASLTTKGIALQAYSRDYRQGGVGRRQPVVDTDNVHNSRYIRRLLRPVCIRICMLVRR